MDKQVFTPDEEENKIFDRYIKAWPHWPKETSTTPEQRITDLEDFTLYHEELIHALYSKIEFLKEEINELKNGR